MTDADPVASAPLVLGAGMSARARPRLGTSHRHHRPGSIGIVGRSTVGFGRIVAAAGSSRPRVTTDALTTWSLRPPFPAWSADHEGADEPPAAARPSWTTRVVPSRSRRAAPPPAGAAVPPRPAAPPKVDALRRLLESRGMIESVAAPDEPARPAASSETVAADARTLADRTATSAGPTTAPGQLGRRARPEAVPTEDRLAAVFPERPTAPTAGRGSARGSPASPRGAEPGGLDRFRAALESRGMVTPTAPPDRAATRPPRDATDPGRDAPARGTPRPTRSPRSPGSPGSPRPVNRRTDDHDDDHRGDDSDDDRPRVVPHATGLPLSLLPELATTARRVIASAGHDPVTTTPPTTPTSAPTTATTATGVVAPGSVRPGPSTPTIGRDHDGPDPVATPGLRLREVGRRSGLPHNWSDVRRPETELAARLLRSAFDVATHAPTSEDDRTSGPVGPEATRPSVRPGPAPTTRHRDGPDPIADPHGEPGASSAPAVARHVPPRIRPGSLAARVARRFAATETAVTTPPGMPGTSDRPRPMSALRRALATTPGWATAATATAAPTPRTAPAATPAPTTTPRTAPTAPSAPTTTPQATPTAPSAPTPRTAPIATPDPTTPQATPTAPSAPAPAASRSIERVPVDPLPAVAPTMSALAEQFLHELRHESPGAPRDLPQPYRPLASAITGSASRVRISHDATSARALRSVGKRAATVGDVIHLQRAPAHDGRAAEILAHELTHVAHPSPVPRFFDDDQRGPEERMAEQVARVIARAPVMPSAPVPARRTNDDVIRRSPDPSARPAARGRAPGTISADALAASIEGRHGPAVQRTTARPSGTASSTTDVPIRRSVAPDATGDHGDGDRSPFGSPQDEREWFERMITRSTEHILRRIEERVMIDFERRGGRLWRNL